MPVKRMASIKGRRENQKEKICIVMFSPNGIRSVSGLHRNIGPRIATPSSIPQVRSAAALMFVQRQLLASSSETRTIFRF